MRHYLTTAAAHLLPQLRALVASMDRHCGEYELFVLADDDAVCEWGQTHSRLACEHVDLFLKACPEMAADHLPGPRRDARLLGITRRWTWARELLAAGLESVTVLDVDTWFLSSPEVVFEEIGAARMAVSPHAFPLAARGLPGVTMESHRRYGLLNAGWVTLADLAPAAELAEACRLGPIAELDHPDENGVVIGEQAALERIAKRHGAHVIRHPGVNVGPWGVHGHPLERNADGVLLFGGRPLVSFHFHSLKPGGQLADANYQISPRQTDFLYAPYIEALRAAR